MLGSFGGLFLLLACTDLLLPTEGKVQKGVIHFDRSTGRHNWQFVSKFAYGLGDGQYSMRTRLQQGSSRPEAPYLDFHIFLDEQWGDVESLRSCKAKKKKAKRTQPLYLSKGGEWSAWASGTLVQKMRPHIWYFAVSDCNQDQGGPPLSLEYEIHLTQVDGSEFSIEMRGMSVWSIAVVMASACFIASYWSRCQSFMESAGGLHTVIWTLSAAMAMQFVAQVLHAVHLWRYSSDGSGLHAMDMISEVLFMLSQVVQTALLIAIGMGYTLLPKRSGHMAIVKWIACFSLVIHAGLVSFGKLQDETACKYHENEGAVGWVLLSVRLLLLAWFGFATQESLYQGGPQLQDFLYRFRVAGILYFLAYPLLFIVVQVFAPYLQHPIMQIGLFLMQSSSVVWLAHLFLSRGTYFKVSVLSNSVLPGATGTSLFDKES